MTQIKIFQPETYPKNIVEVRNEIMNFSDDTKNEIIHEEYLRDYASSKLWDLDSEFGKIHNRLMNYMEGYNIVAYHNTRLLNPNKIVNNGLIFRGNYICLFDYLFISSQMSAKPYFIGSTGILLLW